MIWWGAVVICALVCCVVGLLLLRQVVDVQVEAGLPLIRSQVIYSDSGAWEKISVTLKSETFGIAGKPDYILRTGNSIIPVEVKPLRKASQPFYSDILQLAAYCLLLEEEMGITPPYGLLRYANQTFKIEWNEQLFEQLNQTLDEMHRLEDWPALFEGEMPSPQHDMTVRCLNCGFKNICWPK